MTITILATAACPPTPAQSCSKTSDCPGAELCFGNPDGSGTCRLETAGEGEGEGQQTGEGEGTSTGEGEGEGAPAPSVTLTAAGPTEANDVVDATLNWTVTNFDEASCTLTANGADAGATITSGALAVAVTTTTNYVLTCGPATANLTLTVHSIGAIQGPDVVARGDTGTFTFDASDVANCVITTDGTATSLSAVTIANGTGTFTDVVDADKVYTLTCDGIGTADLVQNKSVTALAVDIDTTSPAVVDAGSDITIAASITPNAICTVSSTASDGSGSRPETAQESISVNGTDRTYDVSGLVEVRELHVTCTLGGASFDASVSLLVRPTVESISGDFTADSPAKLALAWTVLAQDQGDCTFTDGALNVPAPPNGTVIGSGGNLVTYTVTCGFDATDSSPSTASIAVFWGQITDVSQLESLTNQSHVAVVMGSISVANQVNNRDLNTGSITAMSGNFEEFTTTGSDHQMIAPNLVHLGGEIICDTAPGVTTIDLPALTSCKDFDIFVNLGAATHLTSILAPALVTTSSLNFDGPTAVTSVDFHSLETFTESGGLAIEAVRLSNLGAFSFPALTSSVGGIEISECPKLVSVSMPQLQSIVGEDALFDISSPSVSGGNSVLQVLDFSSLRTLAASPGAPFQAFFSVQNNAVLPCAEIEPVFCHMTTRPGFNVQGNASPSCSGITSTCTN